MIIRSTVQEINDYISSSAINQSKLKLLMVGADAFKEVKEPDLFFEEKEHFVIGKAVDDFITMGEEYFNQSYYISSNSKPSALIMSIVQQVFQSRTNDDWFEQDLSSAIDAHSYQPNWKPETRIKKVSEEGEQYWSELVQSEGKQVLSVEQDMKVKQIINQLLTHKYTKELFEDEEGVETYYQLPIYFEVEGVSCKALLDMVKVDHNTEEIYAYDIKTIGDYTKNFDKQCLKRRYDIQASWYMEALIQWMDNNFPNYTLSPISFIVASTTKDCSPLEFVTDVNFINVGKFGMNFLHEYEITYRDKTPEEELESIVKESRVKGWLDLLEDYKWYEENGWDEDKEVTQANGVFFIGSDFTKF